MLDLLAEAGTTPGGFGKRCPVTMSTSAASSRGALAAVLDLLDADDQTDELH